jgi:tripartite-type tricarboxylate transporter receptor subunit TctC
VNADVRRVMERPAFRDRLTTMGFDAIGGDLTAAQAFVASEVAKWRDIVSAVGVQID